MKKQRRIPDFVAVVYMGVGRRNGDQQARAKRSGCGSLVTTISLNKNQFPFLLFKVLHDWCTFPCFYLSVVWAKQCANGMHVHFFEKEHDRWENKPIKKGWRRPTDKPLLKHVYHKCAVIVSLYCPLTTSFAPTKVGMWLWWSKRNVKIVSVCALCKNLGWRT